MQCRGRNFTGAAAMRGAKDGAAQLSSALAVSSAPEVDAPQADREGSGSQVLFKSVTVRWTTWSQDCDHVPVSHSRTRGHMNMACDYDGKHSVNYHYLRTLAVCAVGHVDMSGG